MSMITHHEAKPRRVRFDPHQVGWRIGRAHEPARRGPVVPVGPHRRRHRPPRLRQDPRPAHPRPARRPRRRPGHPHQDRRPAPHLTDPHHATTGPCVVLDPFGLAPGLPELVWDPDRRLRRPDGRRTPRQSVHRRHHQRRGATAAPATPPPASTPPKPPRCCRPTSTPPPSPAAPSTTSCAGSPTRSATEPAEILREHPARRPVLARPAPRRPHGDDRTAGNTITTVQQALSLFFQPDIRRRCVPRPGASGHRHRRHHPPRRHHLPARPRRPLRVGAPR